MGGSCGVSARNVTNITNNYNVSPQLVQQIANAVSQNMGMDMNAVMAQQFQQQGQCNPQALQANMAQAYPAMSPNMAAAQTFSAKGVKSLGKKAKKLAKKGYPQSGLAGVLVSEGVNTKREARAFERKLKSNPEFRKSVEARVGGKFIDDGKCADGSITFAPMQAQLPGIQGNVAQIQNCCGNTGGTVLSGIAQMQGSAMQLMMGMHGTAAGQNLGLTGMGAMGAGAAGLGAAGLGMGAAGLAIGGAGGGGFLKRAGMGLLSGMMGQGFGPMGQSGMEWKLRSAFGMTKSQGGPGSRVAQLPPGASFEDIVAAFMVDVIDDMQKEAMAKMNQIRRSINSQNSLFGKMKGALGGLAGMAGGAAGMVVGGPIGAMIGGGLGQAVGGALGPGADADSRNLMFEELKNIMQKLQQMLQALSNVLNTMHQGAMNSIRNIRA